MVRPVLLARCAHGHSARGLAHSKTLARISRAPRACGVLECGGPPPLCCHGRLLYSGFTLYPPERLNGEAGFVGKMCARPQRQRTGALQDAGANFEGPACVRRLGVRRPSAALLSRTITIFRFHILSSGKAE